MSRPDASVALVICCYTLRRWDDIVAGVRGAADQTRPPASIVIVVDYNDELLARCRAELPQQSGGIPLEVIENHETKGLSGARNTAIAHADAPLIAFLDDDATPDPRWLETLCGPFAESDVVVSGGFAAPRWPESRPDWFPPEFDWVVGCTYRGMPTTTSDVRNVHGATMAYRSEVFDKVGGFVEGVGRVDTIPKGCEETELCIRIRAHDKSARVVYVPTSIVNHRVGPERILPRYYLSRCWAEGLSKAAIAELVGSEAAITTERDYVRKTLVAAVRRNVLAGLRGDLAGFRRTAAVIGGLAATTAGYLAGTIAKLIKQAGRRRQT